MWVKINKTDRITLKDVELIHIYSRSSSFVNTENWYVAFITIPCYEFETYNRNRKLVLYESEYFESDMFKTKKEAEVWLDKILGHKKHFYQAKQVIKSWSEWKQKIVGVK